MLKNYEEYKATFKGTDVGPYDALVLTEKEWNEIGACPWCKDKNLIVRIGVIICRTCKGEGPKQGIYRVDSIAAWNAGAYFPPEPEPAQEWIPYEELGRELVPEDILKMMPFENVLKRAEELNLITHNYEDNRHFIFKTFQERFQRISASGEFKLDDKQWGRAGYNFAFESPIWASKTDQKVISGKNRDSLDEGDDWICRYPLIFFLVKGNRSVIVNDGIGRIEMP